jgi:uncharacterized glyoxalase superfamily protein PhnB
VSGFRDAFPILYVEDVQRAVDFYVSLLGFEVKFRWPEEGADELQFAFLKLEPLGIGIGRRHEHSTGDFELCVYADDIDAAAERLREAGAEEVMPPQDEPWGERRAYFRDRDGHLLHLAMPL